MSVEFPRRHLHTSDPVQDTTDLYRYWSADKDEGTASGEVLHFTDHSISCTCSRDFESKEVQ